MRRYSKAVVAQLEGALTSERESSLGPQYPFQGGGGGGGGVGGVESEASGAAAGALQAGA